MRLLTFSLKAGQPHRIGVAASGDQVIDLTAAARKSPAPAVFDAGDMVSLIAAGGTDVVRKLAASAGVSRLALDSVRVRAPIARPRKNVYCVGWNYVEHFDEGQAMRAGGAELPAYPAFFTKAPTAIIGPYDPIPYDAKISAEIDWEVELGVVIGKTGKNISEDNAMAHVFGYTVINDITARDLQRRHGGQWFKGKSLDGTCPMGPWIVTADELNPDDVELSCRVNGIVKQQSNTRHMYFKIPRLIAELSRGMTLEPGDIISTGTPAGVGMARTPPEFLKAGDLVETEIAGIGVLKNRVGA